MTARRLGALGASLAVLLAAMVAGIGLTGIAAAAAGNVAVSASPVNSTATVTFNASAATAGNDLSFALDGDADGAIQADEALGTVTTNDTTGNGSLAAVPGTVATGDGTYTVYVVEEADGDGDDDTGYPVGDPGAFYDATGTIEIDDTAPTITDFTVTNPGQREIAVTFNVSERVADLRVDVAGPDGGTLTEADFVSTGAGPVTYEASYFAAVDGEYAVTLHTAADAAGNDGAGTEAGTVIAAANARNATAVFEPRTPVFLGETGIDVSPVVGDGRATFHGLGGAAEGRIVSAPAGALDVTAAAGFVPGSYDADGDGTVDLTVRRPTITDLALVLGGASGDLDVSAGYLQTGDEFTVSAKFRFGIIDDLRVSVIDPDGLDVAPGLTTSTILASRDDVVTLSTAAALAPGEYTVEVAAISLNATAATTLHVVDRDLYVTLDRTRVVRGGDVTATVIGPPGDTATVRLPTAGLRNDSAAATAVFEPTGDVTDRATGSHGVAAAVALGRDGIAKVRFDTTELETGDRAVEVVAGGTGHLTDPAADRVPLRVSPRRVTVTDAPAVSPINEAFELRGRAPPDATVQAYARVGDRWHPVNGSGWTRDEVAADGTYDLRVTATGPLDRPGVYQLAVVDVTGADVGAATVLSHAALVNRPYAATTLRTRFGGGPATRTTNTRTPTPAGTDEALDPAPASPIGHRLAGAATRPTATRTPAPVDTAAGPATTVVRTHRGVTATPGQAGFGAVLAAGVIAALGLAGRPD